MIKQKMFDNDAWKTMNVGSRAWRNTLTVVCLPAHSEDDNTRKAVRDLV